MNPANRDGVEEVNIWLDDEESIKVPDDKIWTVTIGLYPGGSEGIIRVKDTDVDEWGLELSNDEPDSTDQNISKITLYDNHEIVCGPTSGDFTHAMVTGWQMEASE